MPMDTGEIFIGDLDKAEVLVALYNASKPLGMGFLHFDPKPMTRDEAAEELRFGTRFDYLHGRVMKVDLAEDMLYTRMYNRDNGDGAAERVIAEIRMNLPENTISVYPVR